MKNKFFSTRLSKSRTKFDWEKKMPAKKWTICAANTRKLFKVCNTNRRKNFCFWKRRRLSLLRTRHGPSILKKRNLLSFRKLTLNREMWLTRKVLKVKRSFTQSSMILWGSSCNRNGKWTSSPKKSTKTQVKATLQYRSCQLNKRQNSNVVKKKSLSANKQWLQESVPSMKKRYNLSNKNASYRVDLMRSLKGKGRLRLNMSPKNKRFLTISMKKIYLNKRRTEGSEIEPST